MKIAILGAQGLVGEALSRTLEEDIIKISRDMIDVRDTRMLTSFLAKEKVDLVINCTAYVGGIEINRRKPYTMYRRNLEISQSVLNACIASDIGKLVEFCSNCTYPENAIQPYKESDLLNGKPVDTNQGYAAAKIAALQAGIAAHTEYGIDIFHPIPCSLYGLRDNYEIERSHFVAAAIRRIYWAVENGQEKIDFWGSGKPYREVLFADELAGAIKKLLKSHFANQPVNISTGVETPIKSIIEIVSKIAGYKGNIIWDKSKPDGAIHKLLDNSKMKEINWTPRYTLIEGLERTCKHYRMGKNIRL